MIESDRLEAFVAFAECASFTRAAERLAISQPSLHVKIRKLSESLGVPLYRRAGRGLVLTREGEALLTFARDAIERSERFEAELRGAGASRPVQLAAGEGAFLYLLGDAIRAFVRRRENPLLRLVTRDRDGTLEAVRLGEADLGVAALDDRPEELTTEPLRTVGAVAVVPSGHRLAARRSLRLADLRGERLIVPPAGRPHRAALSRALTSAGIDGEPVVEARGWELMLHFARLGAGIAVVNDCCRLPRGVVARPLRELPSIVYYLIERDSRDRPPAVTRLRESILRRGPSG